MLSCSLLRLQATDAQVSTDHWLHICDVCTTGLTCGGLGAGAAERRGDLRAGHQTGASQDPAEWVIAENDGEVITVNIAKQCPSRYDEEMTVI